MPRFAFLLALFAAIGGFLVNSPSAHAEQADIAAAGRSVVRVVILQVDGDGVYYLGHGSGVVIGPQLVVTNAHVVQQAVNDSSVLIGVVPSAGKSGYLVKVAAYSPNNDLALLQLTEGGTLTPATVYSGPLENGAAVTALGYPGKVDRAQGLSFNDIIQPQAPVQSNGNFSAGRSSRSFDTLLHTAQISAGDSGGPLLDACGRVIGINSFTTVSDDAESQFYFAISTQELFAFLRSAGVSPQMTGEPCRSLADARQQEEKLGAAALARQQADAQAAQRKEEDLRATARLQIGDERQNGAILAALLLVTAMAAGGVAWSLSQKGNPNRALATGCLAAVLVAGAGIVWLARPSLDSVEDRTKKLTSAAPHAAPAPKAPVSGSLICVIDRDVSRITVSDTTDVPLEWRADGCVNGRTQYGLSADGWSKILVPNEDAAVSVTRFDPQSATYTVDRFLLDYDAMNLARAAHSNVSAPSCGMGEDAARQLGQSQEAIRAALPRDPQEHLVYRCRPAHGG